MWPLIARFTYCGYCQAECGQYIPLTAEEIIISCVILAVSAGRVYNLAASASLYAAPLTQLQ